MESDNDGCFEVQGTLGDRQGKSRGGHCFAIALIAVGLLWPTAGAASDRWCTGCEWALGLGDTYHYWGETGSVVVAATGLLEQGRYELGLFRMASSQRLVESGWSRPRVLGEPYWGVSATRRWQLFARADWRLFFGFGLSYKTEEDLMNSTHWNFASQLGIRLHHSSGEKPDLEFCVRHWSNGGMRLPNRGQDFLTVSLVF